MYAEERQHEIIVRVREMGRVSVAELARRFDVTPETIRRDLEVLSGRGLLSRVHGGAVPTDKLRLAEASLGVRETAFTANKLAIAEKAMTMLPVRDSLTLLLDAGTTTGRVCELLPNSVSVVITNSVPSAGILSLRPDLEVVLLGGTVRGITQATVGEHAVTELSNLRVDVALLGANGFSIDHGFSTPDQHEARIKKAMTQAAHEVWVLADSSKWGVDYLVRFAALDDVSGLITDDGLPSEAAEELRQAGLRVEIAGTRS